MAINPISSATSASVQGVQTKTSAPGAIGKNFEMLMKAMGAGDTSGMQNVIDALKQGPSTEGAGKADKKHHHHHEPAIGGQRAAATQPDIMNAAITPKAPLGQRINTTA
jgi:hypothetical protein